MTLDLRRYGRQVRLSEIGEAGQAKLCQARVSPSTDGFARTIEEKYLRAAGIAALGDGSPPAQGSVSLGLRHAAAREVGEGALAALIAIRGIVGVSGTSEGGT